MSRGIAALEAWDTPFDPVAHAVNNLFVGMKGEVMHISEARNDKVIMTTVLATISNPGIAWLATQPNRYFVFWQQLPGEAEPKQLARGRLQPIPTGLAEITVNLEFVCVPPNEDDVMAAEANAHRIGEIDYNPDAPLADREAAEKYDPLFYSPEAVDDPTNVLLGTLDLYRWHPVTLALERTHLYAGDTIHEIDDGEWGSQDFNLDAPPKTLTRSRIIATWTQSASGDQTSQFMSSRHVSSYNWQALIDGSPKAGDQIGNCDGWTMAEYEVQEVLPLLAVEYGRLTPSPFTGVSGQKVTMQPRRLIIGARAHYEYQQEREETIDLYASTGIQAILQDGRTEPAEEVRLASLTMDVQTPEWRFEDPETLDPIQYVVGDMVQASNSVWRCLEDHEATEKFTARISDPDTGAVIATLWERVPKKSAINARNSRFADTDRGKRAVRCGFRRLQRYIVEKSMCARLRFRVRAQQARLITCRDAVRVINRRLPGGWAIGKVISVDWTVSADEQIGEIEIAIPVGTGEMPTDTAGKQQTGEIYYDFSAPAVNEPVNAYALDSQSPRFLVIENEADLQEGVGHEASFLGNNPVAAIQNVPTAIRVYYEPLRVEDTIVRRMSAHTLPIYIPKGIDLTPEIP